MGANQQYVVTVRFPLFKIAKAVGCTLGMICLFPAQMAKQRKAKKNQKSNALSTHSKEHKKLATAYICAICRQSFPNTAKEPTLRAHVEAKHSGKNSKTFQECFPTFGHDAAPPANANKNKKDNGKSGGKKKKKKGKK